MYQFLPGQRHKTRLFGAGHMLDSDARAIFLTSTLTHAQMPSMQQQLAGVLACPALSELLQHNFNASMGLQQVSNSVLFHFFPSLWARLPVFS